MPTKRDSQSDSAFIKQNAIRYFKRFGRQYTLINYTNTENEDGKITSIAKPETTIWGDLQFNNIPTKYDRPGVQTEGDGMFFTLPDYTINPNDEIVDPFDSTVKWKLTKVIETESVGTGKPYVGYVTVRKQ
jgi:hypothetical protein